MRPVLVDSNVILDVATIDEAWSAWSEATMRRLADKTALVINPLIYAEVSVRYETVEELEAVVPTDVFRRDSLPYEAALLAGKCFRAYRRRGGTRMGGRRLACSVSCSCSMRVMLGAG